MIQRFRKKAVEVEMVQWTGTPESAAEIKKWTLRGGADTASHGDFDGFHQGKEITFNPPDARLWVAHQRSWEPLPLGHWVAKELDGSGFYPISPEGLVSGYDLPRGTDPSGLTVPCEEDCDDTSPHDAHLAPGALERLKNGPPKPLGAEQVPVLTQEQADNIARALKSLGAHIMLNTRHLAALVAGPAQACPPSCACGGRGIDPERPTEPSQDHADYVNRLMEASVIPESWDGEESADWILQAYLLELERRVVLLGGSLERWPEEDDATGLSLRCPTCTSRAPRLHPAAGDGGEVTQICPDAFHKEV